MTGLRDECSVPIALGRSPLWPILLIGGIVAAVVVGWQGRRNRRIRSLRLQSFRGAVVGADKRMIAAALGPPGASAGVGDLLRDDTWYYLLDPAQQTILAIRFTRGVARQTQVVGMTASPLKRLRSSRARKMG